MRKTYVLCGINTAISLLRPNAKYVLSNKNFIEWNDERPIPTIEEIQETIKKIKKFEDSIPSIELE